MNETDAMCFFDVETLAGERVPPHLTHSDRVVKLRDNDSPGYANAHLGNGENGVVGSHDNVAGCNHSGASAETGTLYQRNGRYRKHVEPLNSLRRHARGAQIILRGGAPYGVEPFDVGAGLK